MKVWQLLGDFAEQLISASDAQRCLEPVAGSCYPGKLSGQFLSGFHAREQWNGQTFRWTLPVARMAFELEADDWIVILDTCGLRVPRFDELQLFWNGFAATPDPERSKNGRICFRITRNFFIADGSQQLMLMCSRLQCGDREVRTLGLPLFAIEFAPVACRSSRVAMAMCVQNEERFLAAHLHYHHALGVERAYVYLHGCTDRSLQLVQSFPWAIPIVIPDEFAQRFGQMSDLQRTCMDEALSRAREEDFDWLMFIDADEFAFAENEVQEESPTVRGNLPRMLAAVEPTIDMVRLRTSELVSQYPIEDEAFWEQTHFQNEYVLCRTIFDPFSGDPEYWNKFLGDDIGKSIVRTSARVQAYNAHVWVRDQGKAYPTQPAYLPVPTQKRGRRYHFLVVNVQHFIEKYRKLSWEPNVWHSGVAVEFPKRIWKRVSTTLSTSEIESYLQKHFFLPTETLEAYVEMGKLTRDQTVADVLAESGYFEIQPMKLESTSNPELSTAKLVLAAPPEQSLRSKTYYDSSDWIDGTYTGFYGVELFNGKYFRWAMPDVQITLTLPPQDYCLALELGSLSQLVRSKDILLCWNDVPISSQRIQLKGTCLTFDIYAAQCQSVASQRLGIRASAIDSASWEYPDPRLLAVAIFGIYIEGIAQPSRQVVPTSSLALQQVH